MAHFPTAPHFNPQVRPPAVLSLCVLAAPLRPTHALTALCPLPGCRLLASPCVVLCCVVCCQLLVWSLQCSSHEATSAKVWPFQRRGRVKPGGGGGEERVAVAVSVAVAAAVEASEGQMAEADQEDNTVERRAEDDNGSLASSSLSHDADLCRCYLSPCMHVTQLHTALLAAAGYHVTSANTYQINQHNSHISHSRSFDLVSLSSVHRAENWYLQPLTHTHRTATVSRWRRAQSGPAHSRYQPRPSTLALAPMNTVCATQHVCTADSLAPSALLLHARQKHFHDELDARREDWPTLQSILDREEQQRREAEDDDLPVAKVKSKKRKAAVSLAAVDDSHSPVYFSHYHTLSADVKAALLYLNTCWMLHDANIHAAIAESQMRDTAASAYGHDDADRRYWLFVHCEWGENRVHLYRETDANQEDEYRWELLACNRDELEEALAVVMVQTSSSSRALAQRIQYEALEYMGRSHTAQQSRSGQVKPLPASHRTSRCGVVGCVRSRRSTGRETAEAGCSYGPRSAQHHSSGRRRREWRRSCKTTQSEEAGQLCRAGCGRGGQDGGGGRGRSHEAGK